VPGRANSTSRAKGASGDSGDRAEHIDLTGSRFDIRIETEWFDLVSSRR